MFLLVSTEDVLALVIFLLSSKIVPVKLSSPLTLVPSGAKDLSALLEVNRPDELDLFDKCLLVSFSLLVNFLSICESSGPSIDLKFSLVPSSLSLAWITMSVLSSILKLLFTGDKVRKSFL